MLKSFNEFGMPKEKPKSNRSKVKNLAGVPSAVLQTELKRRQRQVVALVRKHDRLLEGAAALKAEIEALGGAPGLSGYATRPRNAGSLVQTLTKVLTGKTLSADEAMQAVLEAGYRSTSSSFRKIVNITLARSGRFKRVSRGRYAVK